MLAWMHPWAGGCLLQNWKLSLVLLEEEEEMHQQQSQQHNLLNCSENHRIILPPSALANIVDLCMGTIEGSPSLQL